MLEAKVQLSHLVNLSMYVSVVVVGLKRRSKKADTRKLGPNNLAKIGSIHDGDRIRHYVSPLLLAWLSLTAHLEGVHRTVHAFVSTTTMQLDNKLLI